jgi:hypothetical protein
MVVVVEGENEDLVFFFKGIMHLLSVVAPDALFIESVLSREGGVC